MTNENEIYVFNKNYLLKNDKRRFFILKKYTHDIFDELNDPYPVEDVNAIIHPLIALYFALFNGKRTLRDVITEYMKITGISYEPMKIFTEKILDEILKQVKGKFMKFGNHFFYIPKNVIIKSQIISTTSEIVLNDFFIPQKDLDLKSMRAYSPIDCLFEINFSCYTDCIYCYADRKKQKHCSIPINRMKDIIKEAKQIGMRSFNLSGGELFLYPQWEIILQEILANNFRPYISTKIPLSRQMIHILKQLGLHEIQLSIDSIRENEMMEILHVNNEYREKIINTLKMLNEEGFSIFINGQITCSNDSLESVRGIFDFLLKFDNIKSIKFGAAGYSLYKSMENFQTISSTVKNLKEIEVLIDEYKDKYKNIKIDFSGYSSKEKYINNFSKKEKAYNNRVRCSGNFYTFVILPDGQVTICEELYYHPSFIIGDIKKQSINEIWDSKRALELYRFSKEMINDISICKTCEHNERCHNIKGVCWKEILYAYGLDNWDFPDPKCPYAPVPYKKFWIE